MEVTGILEGYLEDKASIERIDAELSELEQLLREPDATIEAYTLKPRDFNEIRSGDARHSRVEAAAEADLTTEIQREIEQLKRERRIAKRRVAVAERILAGLNDKERFMAEKHYVHKWCWEEVSMQYNLLPGVIPKGKEAFEKARRPLILKMERIAGARRVGGA
ncbi:MAG: hypothetical protein ACOYJD_08305 [Christensenellales bacterium]|jgi:hypothetical protein